MHCLIFDFYHTLNSASHVWTLLFALTYDPECAYQNLFSRNAADVLRLSGRTFSTITCGSIHRSWDSSFIMTPSGPFLVTRTSRADHTFSPLADLSLHERTFFCFRSGPFFITRGPLPAARACRTSRTRTIFILKDPGGYFRVTIASRVTLLSTSEAFLFLTCFHHIYHDTRKPQTELIHWGS